MSILRIALAAEVGDQLPSSSSTWNCSAIAPSSMVERQQLVPDVFFATAPITCSKLIRKTCVDYDRERLAPGFTQFNFPFVFFLLVWEPGQRARGGGGAALGRKWQPDSATAATNSGMDMST